MIPKGYFVWNVTYRNNNNLHLESCFPRSYFNLHTNCFYTGFEYRSDETESRSFHSISLSQIISLSVSHKIVELKFVEGKFLNNVFPISTQRFVTSLPRILPRKRNISSKIIHYTQSCYQLGMGIVVVVITEPIV